ncbi:thioesterase family protein [Bacillus sp. CLL-7-23]|uniref:Thioesterase family protein n=1 Tax=Bacillus changyiensis TaxID=3004103 RepID=A0ABT4WZ11_9BACI|nr:MULTISPECIES: thioesterase family protein [Bacillus]MDA7025280.1 thioesterase family protein [Bacillus changyiensis]NPC94568.1 acyl-CoA thioesterase [Bacillus sp. WMMC1349]
MKTKTTFIARYSETDQMGIIHHSTYPVWFEVGRTNFLKTAGHSNTDIESRGILLPLYEMNCQFKVPAKFEDELIVETCIKNISRVRVIFSYKVINCSNHTLIATGETMHAWTNHSLKPINIEKVASDIYLSLMRVFKE